MESATAVFGERGFEAATVSEIARRCGLTTGAIYARWTSKRELFMAAVEHASARRMLLLIKNLDVTADEKLAMLGANLLSPMRDGTRDLWIEASVNASRVEATRPVLAQFLELEERELAEIIDEGKASGVIDPELSTEAIVFLCHSLGFGTHLILRARRSDRTPLGDDDWNSLMARIIDAIGPAH